MKNFEETLDDAIKSEKVRLYTSRMNAVKRLCRGAAKLEFDENIVHLLDLALEIAIKAEKEKV